MDAFIFFTIKSSLCLSAGFLLYFLFLRNETFHRIKRFVLLGIILSSILIPLIKLQVSPMKMNTPVQTLQSAFVRMEPSEVTTKVSEQPPAQLVQDNTPDFLQLIYLGGAAIQGLLILFSLIRIVHFLRKSKKIEYQGLSIALVPYEMVPLCFVRRIIMSENDFRNHGKEMILHEVTHLKELHSLDLLLVECYLVMTWYNPVSWLIRHELTQNHEFEADRYVINHGIDEAEYQLLLVRKVAGESRYKLVNQFNKNHIKTRIAMMNKVKSSPRAILKVLLFIPLIALMVQVFAQKEVYNQTQASTNEVQRKYLVLKPDQLKLLGFEMNPSGLFYKNIRFGRVDKGILCLYFNDVTYSGSIILRPGEKITGSSAPSKILKKQALTNYDFYPVVVASFNGSRTQDMIAAEKDPNMKLLPIQVNMSDLNLGKRADTLIFWFKPTESLKNILLPVARIENYMQTCPVDSRSMIKKGNGK